MSKLAIDYPEFEFAALIFDLDGTLADSMPVHFRAWCRALEEHGAPSVFPEDVFYAMGGRPSKDIVEILNGDQGLSLDPEAVAHSKKKYFLEELESISLIEEVSEFAREHEGKVPMAVASGGSRIVVEKTLQVLGISDWFDEVITSDDVEHGKPAPDIFLEAAERLGVAPHDCLVFEDARPGIEAAREAGMEVVVVPTHLHVD